MLASLFRLRIQALMNEVGGTVDISMLETATFALEDAWDDLSVTLHMVSTRASDFEPEKLDTLKKALPWIAVENAIGAYSRCIAAGDSTQGTPKLAHL